MKCETCPFNDGLNEEATKIQNLGCLPTPHDMVRHYDTTGVAMSCHFDQGHACRGLAEVRPDASQASVWKYEEWYRGIPCNEAVSEAATDWLDKPDKPGKWATKRDGKIETFVSDISAHSLSFLRERETEPGVKWMFIGE